MFGSRVTSFSRTDSEEVGALLEECLRAARTLPASPQRAEAERRRYCGCRDSLCAELASLLQEAVDMKWPFVPEKWQYKQSLAASDKANLSDLIKPHLPQLLAVLKASILAQEARVALAAVFLVDRFLYWTDESSRLLKIAKLLHRHHPEVPVAPQLVIRQARVYLNSGKLQKAEYILSSLINSSGATGCWVYQSESDRALVQAVSVQVRGTILQKLGLWLEAAELIWASLVGYFALPQPDKKGISTSLGILANILVSMNDEDFRVFTTNPDIDLRFLGDGSHRLLSAAEAAKMAVVYSQYTSLFVLTNTTIQGTCLLSYSFSVECPPARRPSFLLLAREAFVIGLLTKAEGELVTSQQELHTFIKAAYSLAVTHKWLGAPSEVVKQATQACQKALAHFCDYCHAGTQDKDGLCVEILQLITQVKRLLQVEPFLNSDGGSFIPDSYRKIKDMAVDFTLDSFSKVMRRFQKYHSSLCEISSTNCRGMKEEVDGAGVCITALGTTVSTLPTEGSAEASKGSKDASPGREQPQQRVSAQREAGPESSSDRGGSHANVRDISCATTEEGDDDDDASMLESANESKKRDRGRPSAVLRSAASTSSSSSASRDSEKFEMLQAATETETADDWMTDVVGVSPPGNEGTAESLSQLILGVSSCSLSDSFSSHSSWEKVSADLNFPASRKPQTPDRVKAGSCPTSKSPESDGSFFLLGTPESDTGESAHNPTHMNHTPRCRSSDMSKPRPLEEDQNTRIHSASKNHAATNTTAHRAPPTPEECASTETSENSFEVLELNESGHSEVTCTEKGSVPERRNPRCHSCKNSSLASAAPEGRYFLSQQDYLSLLAGVCHECLLKRLQSDKTHFKLKQYGTAHGALHLKFSKVTGLWTARETCVFIGQPMGMKGKQRTAIWVQFLHQEERLSSYVAKDYLEPKEIQFHLKDVERQMTAQYYVTEFNKSLYDKEEMAQIFFIPSEALLMLEGSQIVGCVTVEPYMLGEFVKLTNNTGKKNKSSRATEYGLAFGHFTYLFSDQQEVVVDLQGWVTGNGKGLTYLTDPQIHSTKTARGPSNFAGRGIRFFVEEQHGPECNHVCRLLSLPPLTLHGPAHTG
ncbi:alpha-protein kinase 1 isoform 1-T2 [Aulostomus maculatus]